MIESGLSLAQRTARATGNNGRHENDVAGNGAAWLENQAVGHQNGWDRAGSVRAWQNRRAKMIMAGGQRRRANIGVMDQGRGK